MKCINESLDSYIACLVSITDELKAVDYVILRAFDKTDGVRGYQTTNIRGCIQIVLKSWHQRTLPLGCQAVWMSGRCVSSSYWRAETDSSNSCSWRGPISSTSDWWDL